MYYIFTKEEINCGLIIVLLFLFLFFFLICPGNIQKGNVACNSFSQRENNLEVK